MRGIFHAESNYARQLYGLVPVENKQKQIPLQTGARSSGAPAGIGMTSSGLFSSAC